MDSISSLQVENAQANLLRTGEETEVIRINKGKLTPAPDRLPDGTLVGQGEGYTSNGQGPTILQLRGSPSRRQSWKGL
jgi:hypothetical protein